MLERRKSSNKLNNPLSSHFGRSGKTSHRSLSRISVRPAITQQGRSLMVVGNPSTVKEITAEAEILGVKVKTATYVKDIKELYDGTEVGLIYALPLKRSHITSVHANLQRTANFRALPAFAVAPEWMDNKTERQMYKVGIRMVMEWPKEKTSFRRLMAKALKDGFMKVKAPSEDTATSRAIKNRLKAEGFDLKKLRTPVFNGIVIPRGEVSSSAFKKRLVTVLKEIPGIRKVVTHSLFLWKKSREKGAELSEALLNKTLREANRLLRESVHIGHRTMDAKRTPTAGQLLLRGTAPSKTSVELAIGMLKSIPYVASVKDRVIVSPKVHKGDSFLARRAQKIVDNQTRHQNGKIRVKVVSGVAILRGDKSRFTNMRGLRKTIKSMSGIHQIKDETLSAS